MINVPPSSSTKNDCASGSHQPTWRVSSLIVVVILWLWVWVSWVTSAFLIERITSWTVFKEPVDLYSTCAAESTVPGSLESFSLVVNLNSLVPVDQRGLVLIPASGINNDALYCPLLSEIHLRSLTTALAPEAPCSTSPTWTLPKYSPTAWAAREVVLMLIKLVVEAYDDGSSVSS